jgi:hypothetical protein
MPEHKLARPDVALVAEYLASEDVAVLESFRVRPTIGLDDVELSARTLLPLSVVNERVGRLLKDGLLRESRSRSGRVVYVLGWTGEPRKKFKIFGR